jgi:hypothetical protein
MSSTQLLLAAFLCFAWLCASEAVLFQFTRLGVE